MMLAAIQSCCALGEERCSGAHRTQCGGEDGAGQANRPVRGAAAASLAPSSPACSLVARPGASGGRRPATPTRAGGAEGGMPVGGSGYLPHQVHGHLRPGVIQGWKHLPDCYSLIILRLC